MKKAGFLLLLLFYFTNIAFAQYEDRCFVSSGIGGISIDRPVDTVCVNDILGWGLSAYAPVRWRQPHTFNVTYKWTGFQPGFFEAGNPPNISDGGVYTPLKAGTYYPSVFMRGLDTLTNTMDSCTVDYTVYAFDCFNPIANFTLSDTLI